MKISILVFPLLPVLAAGCVQSHRARAVVYTPVVPVETAPLPPVTDRPEPRIYATPAEPPPPAVVTPQAAPADVAIAESVRDLMKNDPSLEPGAGNILTTVKDGVVTLTGSVPAEHYRTELKDIISKLPGVRSVEDNLEVNNR